VISERPSAGTCKICLRGFGFDPRFYEERGLLPPATCRPCRQERDARCVDVEAFVESVGPRFAFARAADGRCFYLALDRLPRELRPLRRGAALLLRVDPLDRPPPGRHPRPWRVCRAPSSAAPVQTSAAERSR
jgi:hypothetical protein